MVTFPWQLSVQKVLKIQEMAVLQVKIWIWVSIVSMIDCQNKMNGEVAPAVASSTASLVMFIWENYQL